MTTPLSTDEARLLELRTLLDEIGSGSILEVESLEAGQLALLREHLSEEELEELFDRSSEEE